MDEKITYEIYQKELSEDEYFSTWEQDQLDSLTSEIKKYIYAKYIMKYGVFTRDNFKCQNIGCKTPDSKITCHHIKMVKNNGHDKPRNGVSLCNACHKGFHSGRNSISFSDNDILPSHIRGITFKSEIRSKPNWKKFKSNMREMRKNNRDVCGLKLSYDQISLLMKFLRMIYDDEND